MFANGCTVAEQFGDHIRQISGKIHFKPELLEEPGRIINGLVTITYQLMPNCAVITSPYYMSVMILIPESAGKTRVDYYMLTPGPADNPKAKELYAKSYDMILKVFGTKDFRAAEISQLGLASGAVDELSYCGLEEPIIRFYTSLERHLRLEPVAA